MNVHFDATRSQPGNDRSAAGRVFARFLKYGCWQSAWAD
jgi:hypothetical protein